MRLESIDTPEPGSGEALVRVTAAGICGSDVHGFTGASGRRTPGMVMGHEFAGVVEGASAPEAGVAAGKRVAVNPLSGCGECEQCARGHSHICPSRRTIGVNTGASGGFSEYVTVPVDNLIPLADTTTDAEGSLAEPLAVALRAVNLSGLSAGEPTLVLGGGTIGLCLLLVCNSKGIGPVFLTDRIEHRLDVARQLGAEALHADAEPVQRVLDATDNSGVRSSLDAVGIAPTVRQALQSTQRGGKVVLVGLAQPGVEIPLYELVPQERCIQGSYAYTPEEYREAVRLLNDRVVDASLLVERSVSLEDGPQAFRDLAAGRDQSVKVIVEP